MSAIRKAYDRAALDDTSYRPVFMYLDGKWVGSPETGFGADYPAAFRARRLLKTVPDGKCFPPAGVGGLSAKQHLKITFSLDRLDEGGLVGVAGAKRDIAYEFCIPAGKRFRDEVMGIDPTVSFASGTPGRVDCGRLEYRCTGSTHQPGFRQILKSLADLPYVHRIDASDFE
jgi:hypothetical protein